MSPRSRSLTVGLLGVLVACGGRGSSSQPPKKDLPTVSVTVVKMYEFEQLQVTWGQASVSGYQVEVAIEGVWGTPHFFAPGQYAIVTFPGIPDASIVAFRVRVMLGDTAGPWGPETSFQFGVRPPGALSVRATDQGLVYAWARMAIAVDSLRLDRSWVRADGTIEPRGSVELPVDAQSFLDDDVAGWVDGRAPSFLPVYTRRGVESVGQAQSYIHAPLHAPDLSLDVSELDLGLSWTENSAGATETHVWSNHWGLPESSGRGAYQIVPRSQTSLDDPAQEYGLYEYEVKAWAPLATSEVVRIGTFLVPPSLAARFDASTFTAMPALQVAGDAERGWVLLGMPGWPTWKYAVQDGAGWRTGTVGQTNGTPVTVRVDPSSAVVLTTDYDQATASANVVTIRRSTPGGDTDEVVSVNHLRIDSLRAAARDGVLHLAWREDDGIHHALGEGGQASTLVSCAGDAMTVSLAIGTDGEPALVASTPTGTGHEYLLARRSGGVWSCEPVPLPPYTGSVVLLAGDPSTARVAGVSLEYPPPFGGIVLVERDAAGWGPAEVVTATTGYVDALRAVESASGRLAIAATWPPGYSSPLLVREPGETAWWREELGMDVGLGLDSTGKLGLLVGTGGRWDTGSEPHDHPYGLLLER